MCDIKGFYDGVLSLKYISGSYNNNSHENAILSLLQTNGFKQATIVATKKKSILSKKQRNEILSSGVWDKLDNGEYIHQPCGKNDSPDIIVKCNDKLYFLECKSSKMLSPMFNGCIPKKEYIYIFSSEKYNETTMFYGMDIMSFNKRLLYEQMTTELQQVLDKYRNTEEWLDDKRGFDFYIRKMFIQVGPASNTDYFTHADRETCEMNVLNSMDSCYELEENK